MIVYELELDCFQANGKDYIRLITTRADNLTDYQMYDEDTPFPSVHTVLQILQASGNDNDSDTNGGIMPVVGELTLFRGQGLAVASVYRQDFVMVVVGMVDTLGFWHPTTHTVFTIDTFNPTNPHVMEELFLPVKSLELYSLDDTWIVGISSYHTTDEHPFPQPLQLVLWNASDRHGATQAPYLWIDDTVLLTNGTGINSTISQVVSNMADDYSVAAALRYIKESNVLVMPVYTERYKIRPCPSYDWMYEGPQSSSHNQRLFNDTCRYDQVTVFDGFWILKIDLAPATTTSASNAERSDNGIRNITKHFAINHASTDLLRRGCVGSYSTVPTRSLAFNGDVMTMKRNAILSHDLLTKVEADPVIFFSTDCN